MKINVSNVCEITFHSQKGDAAISRHEIELPSGWDWQSDWDVDLNRAVDEEGGQTKINSFSVTKSIVLQKLYLEWHLERNFPSIHLYVAYFCTTYNTSLCLLKAENLKICL